MEKVYKIAKIKFPFTAIQYLSPRSYNANTSFQGQQVLCQPRDILKRSDHNSMILTLLLLCAAISDARTGKIPNLLIGCGIAFGGVSLIWQKGPYGLVLYLGRFVLILLPLYFVYLTKTLGAGDVKLLSVLVAWLGINASSLLVVWLSFLTALFMAMFAVVVKKGKMKIKELLHTPINLAPAIFVGWIIYLGGTYIG